MKKNQVKFKTIYSKVLLFGEYAVLLNSRGLSIPYTHYMGELSRVSDEKYTDLDFAFRSNEELKKYASHLQQLDGDMSFSAYLDIKSLMSDLEQGLYFESTIPQGYGLGSSGALVAAIYDAYGDKTVRDLVILRGLFSKMEAYFHGTSSGLDPLLCFSNAPLLIDGLNAIEKVKIPGDRIFSHDSIFLINTGSPENTGHLVNLFLSKYKNASYAKLVDQYYIVSNNTCINSILSGNQEDFYKALRSISEFQLEHMMPMIPGEWLDLWKQGLATNSFYLKLLGSGGGGFLLGFTRDRNKAQNIFNKRGIETILVYGH